MGELKIYCVYRKGVGEYTKFRSGKYVWSSRRAASLALSFHVSNEYKQDYEIHCFNLKAKDAEIIVRNS